MQLAICIASASITRLFILATALCNPRDQNYFVVDFAAHLPHFSALVIRYSLIGNEFVGPKDGFSFTKHEGGLKRHSRKYAPSPCNKPKKLTKRSRRALGVSSSLEFGGRMFDWAEMPRKLYRVAHSNPVAANARVVAAIEIPPRLRKPAFFL